MWLLVIWTRAVCPVHLHCHPLVYIMVFQTRKMLGYEVVIHRVLCAVDVAHQQTKSSSVLSDIIGLGDPSNVNVLCYYGFWLFCFCNILHHLLIQRGTVAKLQKRPLKRNESRNVKTKMQLKYSNI